MLVDYGNRHFAPEGASTAFVDAKSGAPAEPMLVDRASGRPLEAPDFAVVAGPGASESMKARIARRRSSLLAGPFDREARS